MPQELPVPPINVLSLTEGADGLVGMGSGQYPATEAFRHRARGQVAVRAAIFRGPRDIEVGERPDPVIGEPTDAIIRVVLACGADAALECAGTAQAIAKGARGTGRETYG